MSNLAKVAILYHEVEAHLMKGILEDRNIPHVIRSYRDEAYNGIFQLQKGWGALYVPKDYSEDALAILADLRNGENLQT